VQPEVTRQRILIEEALADTLPPVLGARIELQQVLLNLIVNGIEAMADMAEGARTLAIGVEPRSYEGGPGVVVVVRDSGRGVPDGDIERLFDPFYTTKPHGLGMGLSISRSIVQAHGGRLWAAANEERGITFEVLLPAMSAYSS
jgi:C4-dicarboxylate-specific signal transduction histidine kinase